jgi:membrane-associated HD superfamily phosphohydrolase
MTTPDDSFGARIMQFQKSIPLVIGAVSIGVCTVNRTTIKWMIHLSVATLIGFIFQYFTRMFTTAFLFSSFAYVLACANMDNVDDFLKISMVVGFAVLWLIDLFTVKMESTETNFTTTYLVTVIISGLIGLLSVFIVKTVYPKNAGKDYLYDFNGCSCDDCAPSKKKQILMRRIQ